MKQSFLGRLAAAAREGWNQGYHGKGIDQMVEQKDGSYAPAKKTGVFVVVKRIWNAFVSVVKELFKAPLVKAVLMFTLGWALMNPLFVLVAKLLILPVAVVSVVVMEWALFMWALFCTIVGFSCYFAGFMAIIEFISVSVMNFGQQDRRDYASA